MKKASPSKKKEKPPYTFIGVRFPRDIDTRLRKLADKSGKPISQLLLSIVNKQLPAFEAGHCPECGR